MSFILDALRKSEHERQRQLGPSIAELPVARPAPRVPAWVWVALAALLTLNVATVAWFMTRDPAAPAPATAPAVTATESAAPPAPAAPGPSAATATAPTPQPIVAAPLTPAAPPAPLSAAAAPAAPPAAGLPAGVPRDVRPLTEEAYSEPPAPSLAAPEAPDPSLLPLPPEPMPRSAATAAGLPTLDQLPPQATAGLPPLAVNLHIYAAQPAQRAVFINGTRYREGDSLPGGAELQQITPDGAVLSYRGQRFLLPRQ